MASVHLLWRSDGSFAASFSRSRTAFSVLPPQWYTKASDDCIAAISPYFFASGSSIFTASSLLPSEAAFEASESTPETSANSLSLSICFPFALCASRIAFALASYIESSISSTTGNISSSSSHCSSNIKSHLSARRKSFWLIRLQAMAKRQSLGQSSRAVSCSRSIFDSPNLPSCVSADETDIAASTLSGSRSSACL